MASKIELVNANGKTLTIINSDTNNNDIVFEPTNGTVTVENVLTSTSTVNALSAAQGKVLQDGKVANSRVLTDVPAGALFTDTVYTHPTSDGSLHVPATGTTNSGKVLTAGATAGSMTWEALTAGSSSLDGLTDVTITTPASGQVVSYNGTGWVNSTPASGVTDHTLLTNIGTRTHAQLESDISGKQATLVSATNIKTVNSASILGSGDLVVTDASKLPLTGGDMTGTIRYVYQAMAANDIAVSTADIFSKTISGATTLTVSSIPASPKVSSFWLELTNGGSAVITWFSGVKWASGTAPTLTAAGLDILQFYTRDGGTTWRGAVISKDNR